MAANRPPARARARRGSLERPINARLYRGTWLLVGIPLLIAAFSVGKPAALRAAVPTLPPAFDKARATALARDLAQTFPDRSPGSPGALSARQWFADEVVKIGLRADRFAADFLDRIVASVVLDSIAGRNTARLVIAGNTARQADPGLVETTAARIQEQAGAPPRRPNAFAQLLDLAFPLTLYE